MITNEHIEQFIAQAHRYGDAKLMLCSSGNLSWRIGEEALISGTGSWVPTLGKEKVSICHIASGIPANGVKPSMESTFHLGISEPTWQGISAVTLKFAGLFFMQETAVAYSDWKWRTTLTSRRSRRIPKWNVLSIEGFTPLAGMPLSPA